MTRWQKKLILPTAIPGSAGEPKVPLCKETRTSERVSSLLKVKQSWNKSLSYFKIIFLKVRVIPVQLHSGKNFITCELKLLLLFFSISTSLIGMEGSTWLSERDATNEIELNRMGKSSPLALTWSIQHREMTFDSNYTMDKCLIWPHGDWLGGSNYTSYNMKPSHKIVRVMHMFTLYWYFVISIALGLVRGASASKKFEV